MERRASQGFSALTEKEKQTLRLIVRGHDAKSIARHLGLSVHTINERLRDARRKMAVSSSREAARLLAESEGDGPAAAIPDPLGYSNIGEDAKPRRVDRGAAPTPGAGPASRRPRIIFGGLLMTLALALFAALAGSPVTSTSPQTPAAPGPAAQAAVVDSARRWLALLDQGRWEASYRATGSAFRKLNTVEVWAAASDEARAPLGAVISRALVSQETLPAPPYGYEVVKFRTRFANKADAVETVTLDHEDGDWRVVGVTIG